MAIIVDAKENATWLAARSGGLLHVCARHYFILLFSFVMSFPSHLMQFSVNLLRKASYNAKNYAYP